MVWSPCSLRDSQESSPTPQFKSINSSMLRLLYGSSLTSIHDYWKNHIFEYTDICLQRNVSIFWYAVYIAHSFPSKEQAFSTFMVEVNICSDFAAQEKKVCHCFDCFPIYLPWSDGTICHDLSFLNAEFEANFFTPLFQFHQDTLQFLFCWGPAWGTPPMAKVMRKEAQHTQRRDRASGVPLEILKHLPP